MSELQFQKALTMLIRLPDHNRTDIENFLKKYQLEDHELENLLHLAKHREVQKFGFKLRRFRVEFFIQALPLSLEHILEKDLIDFYRKEFEPYFFDIEARSVYRNFRQFFMQFKKRQSDALFEKYFGKNLPDYFFDLMEFELIEGELEFQGFVDHELAKLPLLHHKFETLSLDFKIHEYAQEKRNLSKEEGSSLVPELQKTHLLFLHTDENRYGHQVFEIDEIGVNFLNKSRLGQSAEPPPYYEDFKACGLCS